MRTSPELQRNLWLELSPSRLVIMPLILAAVFYLAYVSDDSVFGKGVSSAAIGLFFVIGLIWGTKLAAETIMNEIRDHTWDGQRMSSLSPWELTVGKLFGSTVYSWYGAGICLAVYWLAMVASEPVKATRTVLALFFTGILAHAVSLLASLMALQKERRYNRSQTAAMLLFGIFIAGPFFSMVLGRSSTVTWYGSSFDSLDFLILSLGAYAAWAVTGVQRLMRLELQMRNLPWRWYGFVLFVMVHLGGLPVGRSSGSGHLAGLADSAPLAAYFVALGSVYLMVFIERKDFLTLRNLLRLAQSDETRRILERAPRWLLTLPLAGLAGLWLIISSRSGTAGMFTLAAFVAASLLFLLRDLGIIVLCNLGRNTKRADIFALICLALLHGVFPAIVTAMKQETLSLFFWPRTDLMPALAVVTALVELGVVAWLVTLRWRQRLAEG